MATFQAILRDPNNSYDLADPRLTLRPMRWRSKADGGFYSARIEVSGAREAVASVGRHLAHDVLIQNELGQSVWRGYVHEVEVWEGGQTVSISMDGIVNRVAVAYAHLLPDGGDERRTTNWAEDAHSVSLYGQRELLLSSRATSLAEAEAERDSVLARYARPEPSFTLDDGMRGVGATLYCRGYYERFDQMYYANTKGLEEHVSNSRGEIALGGQYTATTISFEAQDDVLDSAGGLGGLPEGENFIVSGSALNNGEYNVASTKIAGYHFEVSVKTILDEIAGASITLARDADRATYIDQSFQVTFGPWDVYTVALRLRRVGTAYDNFRVRIWPDSGGNPDTSGGIPLANGEIAGGNIPLEDEWVEITLDTPCTLAAGTTYHMVLTRTGAPNVGIYYMVSVDEENGYASGSLKVYKDGSWQASSIGGDLIFRLTGLEDTATQLEDIFTESGLFVAGGLLEGYVIEDDPIGVISWQYREGDHTCLAEIEDLVALGDGAGERLLISIDAEKRLRVQSKPAQSALDPILQNDGSIAGIDAGQMIAGRWVRIGNPLMVMAMGASAIFADECEYDAVNGQMSVQSETSPDRISLQ